MAFENDFAQEGTALLKKMSNEEAWHFITRQLENAWGVAFIAKHNVRICGDRYTVLENFGTHKIGLCPHFDTYWIKESFRQKILSTPGSFRFHTMNEIVASV